MLKIKDNVDLKELEKFGFYQANEILNCWVYELPYDEEYNFCYKTPFAMLEIQDFTTDKKGNLVKVKDRVFSLTIMQDDECTYSFDILFDLIQAGIVEKEFEDE